MNYLIERLPPPSVAVKSAEHRPDQHRKGRQHNERDGSGEETGSEGGVPGQGLSPADADGEPAVLVDAHHHETHGLDGVAAYQAAARKARMALGRTPSDPPAAEHRNAAMAAGAYGAGRGAAGGVAASASGGFVGSDTPASGATPPADDDDGLADRFRDLTA